MPRPALEVEVQCWSGSSGSLPYLLAEVDKSKFGTTVSGRKITRGWNKSTSVPPSCVTRIVTLSVMLLMPVIWRGISKFSAATERFWSESSAALIAMYKQTTKDYLICDNIISYFRW